MRLFDLGDLNDLENGLPYIEKWPQINANLPKINWRYESSVEVALKKMSSAVRSVLPLCNSIWNARTILMGEVDFCLAREFISKFKIFK